MKVANLVQRSLTCRQEKLMTAYNTSESASLVEDLRQSGVEISVDPSTEEILALAIKADSHSRPGLVTLLFRKDCELHNTE